MQTKKWFEVHLDTEEGRQQIRREIAERVGWRVKRHEHSDGEPYWTVSSPDGKTVEVKTWWSMPIAGWGIEADAWRQVPDYPNDLNAAATLHHPGTLVIVTRYPDNRVKLRVESFGVNEVEHFAKEFTLWRTDAWTEATLRCIAWLGIDDDRKNQHRQS